MESQRTIGLRRSDNGLVLGSSRTGKLTVQAVNSWLSATQRKLQHFEKLGRGSENAVTRDRWLLPRQLASSLLQLTNHMKCTCSEQKHWVFRWVASCSFLTLQGALSCYCGMMFVSMTSTMLPARNKTLHEPTNNCYQYSQSRARLLLASQLASLSTRIQLVYQTSYSAAHDSKIQQTRLLVYRYGILLCYRYRRSGQLLLATVWDRAVPNCPGHPGRRYCTVGSFSVNECAGTKFGNKSSKRAYNMTSATPH